MSLIRLKLSGSAREMGPPLIMILGQAEALLERTEDETTQAALRSIVRQGERLLPLRQQLCALDHGLLIELYASDLTTVLETPDSHQDLIKESETYPR